MNRFIILSGCSGGGKSTLLAELARRGFATVEEPGRRIVIEEIRDGGNALPWIDLEAFARRAIAVALEDRQHAPEHGTVFFDRGLIDAASALREVSGDPSSKRCNANIAITGWSSLPRPGRKSIGQTRSVGMILPRPWPNTTVSSGIIKLSTMKPSSFRNQASKSVPTSFWSGWTERSCLSDFPAAATRSQTRTRADAVHR